MWQFVDSRYARFLGIVSHTTSNQVGRGFSPGVFEQARVGLQPLRYALLKSVLPRHEKCIPQGLKASPVAVLRCRG